MGHLMVSVFLRIEVELPMPNQLPNKPRPRGARKRSAHSKSTSTDRPPVTHGYVKSFDGTKLFYSIEGRGKPVVFCYGLVCSSLHWTYQIEHFQASYQAVWFDYRGHQNSEAPKNLDSLTLENIARDLKTILDELAISDVVLLGHSMGVNVALEFYRQQPARVAGMILANGTAKRPLETLFHHNALQSAFHILKRIYRKSPKLCAKIWKSQKSNPFTRTLVSLGGFNPHLTPQADIEMYIDQVIDMDPEILIHLIENYDAYDATAWLHTVQTPTLIIAGEQDRLIPVEQQELMHQLIPSSRLEVIRHGSHCPQMDLPDLVNLKIEKFLNEIRWESKYVSNSSLTKETASPPTVPPVTPATEALS
jgi:pimeloyl-ACP methyl ester carboxylesterase